MNDKYLMYIIFVAMALIPILIGAALFDEIYSKNKEYKSNELEYGAYVSDEEVACWKSCGQTYHSFFEGNNDKPATCYCTGDKE